MTPDKQPRRRLSERSLDLIGGISSAISLIGLAATVQFVLPSVLIPVLALAILGALAVLRSQRPDEDEDENNTLDARIADLAKSLTDASHAIHAIETEVNARQQVVARLEEDAARYEKLIELRGPEVEAIVQTLRGELASSERRTFRQTAIQNFVFFVLGVVASGAVALLAQ